MLMARFYAHLIANQKHILAIGGMSSQESIKKTVQHMNLEICANKKVDNETDVYTYTQTLSKVLASDNVVKMILSKQECPEE